MPRIPVQSFANGTVWARTAIPLSPIPLLGSLPNASCSIVQHGTQTALTVYEAETGSGTLSSLETGADGTVPGWLDANDVNTYGADLVVQTSAGSETFVLAPVNASGAPVLSVNGKTGTVELASTDLSDSSGLLRGANDLSDVSNAAAARTNLGLGTAATSASGRCSAHTRDSHTCVLCGAPATQVDHIVSVADGGQSTLENTRSVCANCNLEARSGYTPSRPANVAAKLAELRELLSQTVSVDARLSLNRQIAALEARLGSPEPLCGPPSGGSDPSPAMSGGLLSQPLSESRSQPNPDQGWREVGGFSAADLLGLTERNVKPSLGKDHT